MKQAWDALRLTFSDIWDSLFVLLGTGLAGGLLSLLLLPLPLVIAGYYGVASRLTRGDFASFRDWVRLAKEHAGFFYKWIPLSLLVVFILISNVWFYWRLDAFWAQLAGSAALSMLIMWSLPQPYVGALYLRQHDRRLRLTLRNAVIVAVRAPVSTLLMWLLPTILLLVAGLTSVLFIPMIAVVIIIFATRVVDIRLEREGEA